MKFATISTSTILSSAMAIATPNAVTSKLSPPMIAAAQSNRMEVNEERFKTEALARGLMVEAVEVERWTAEKSARFKELARKESLGGLAVIELAELESLTRLWRFEKHPRSAEEILWQRRQQKLTRSLVQALEAYVQFHEAPRNP